MCIVAMALEFGFGFRVFGVVLVDPTVSSITGVLLAVMAGGGFGGYFVLR